MCSAVAAGMCFVFIESRRAVLITYHIGEDLLSSNFELSEREYYGYLLKMYHGSIGDRHFI